VSLTRQNKKTKTKNSQSDKEKSDGVYIYSIASQSCSLAETLVIFAFRKVWLLYGVPVIISVTIQSLIAQSETRPLKSSAKY